MRDDNDDFDMLSDEDAMDLFDESDDDSNLFEDSQDISDSDNLFGSSLNNDAEDTELSSGGFIFGEDNDTESEEEFGGLSDNSSEFSFDNSNNIGSDNNTNTINNTKDEPDSNNPKEIKKTGYFAMLLGLGVLVAVFFIANIVNGYSKKNRSTNPDQDNIISSTTNDEISESLGVKDKPIDNKPLENSNNNVVSSYTGEEDWVSIGKTEKLGEKQTVQSSFTVTNIDYLAKVSNSLSDKQVKAKVSGNIDGLIGTYVLEIPYSVSQNLSLGVSFKINYNMYYYNDSKVIEIADFN